MDLLPAALGVMILSTEAVGVARALAAADDYAIDVSRELCAHRRRQRCSPASRRASSSRAARARRRPPRTRAARRQLASVVAPALILLTGAFLAPLFEELPQATLAAIVIVAVAGFFRVDELRRFARLPAQRDRARR